MIILYQFIFFVSLQYSFRALLLRIVNYNLKKHYYIINKLDYDDYKYYFLS